MDVLKNKKVYVGKFSKEIQEKALALGYKYERNEGENYNSDFPFFYFDDDHFIRYGSFLMFFNNHKFEEVTPEWILNLPEPKKNILEDEKIKNFHLNENGKIIKDFEYVSSKQKWFRQFNVEEEAEAYKILPELLYWRDKYNEGWRPDWKDENYFSIGVDCCMNIEVRTNIRSVLTFKNRELLDMFLIDFKDKLEIVKHLL